MKLTFKLLSTLLLFIVVTLPSMAQKSYLDLNSYKNTNKRLSLLGNSHTLTFENNRPVITKHSDGEAAYVEDTYDVSHPVTGERILYTKRLRNSPLGRGDHYNVYNKYGEVIENGTFYDTSFKLLGQILFPALVPFINGENKYYLFYTFGGDISADFKYAIIDMDYNNGRGRILPAEKDIPIALDQPYEYSSIFGIPGNNCNYYVVAYNYGKYRFETYEIGWNGINTTPIISEEDDFGIVYPLNKKNIYISPDRSLIAVPYISILTLADYNVFHHMYFYKFDADNGLVTKQYYLETELLADTNLIKYRKPSYSNNMNMSGVFTKDSKKFILAVNHFSKNEARNLFEYDLSNIEKNGIIPPKDFGGDKSGKKPIQFKVFDNRVLTFKNIDNLNLEIYSQDYNTFQSVELNNNTRIIQTDSLSQYKNNIFSEERALFFGSSMPFPYIGTDTIQTTRKDTTMCSDVFNVALEARPGKNYIWSNGSRDSIINVTDYGKYHVLYSDDCATRIDTFIVRDLRDELRMPEWDTTVCEQRFPWLLINPYKAERYIWNGVEGTNEYRVYAPTDELIVTVDIQGCRLTDTFTIQSKPCECDYFIPNAFSPNNDGMNDFIKPIFLDGCVPYDYSFEIYNRWGQMVYKSNREFDDGWNGMLNDKPADVGNYYYLMHFKSKSYPEPVSKKGEFILVR